MNPNRGEGPGNLESLPLPPSPEAEQQHEQAVEAPPARPEQVGKQAPKQPALPAVPDGIPAIDQPILAAPPQKLARPIDTDPHMTAADIDRIEHVWVDKVKDVQARTQDDPYIRSSEVSKIKAEYNLKRFNKQIKADEAA
jgi:hypothetical protein